MITNVSKESLLATLRTNRENHHTIYEQAYEAYCSQLITELEENLAAAKNRKRILRTHTMLPIPEDHTDDYDSVIQLLEMSLDEEIELNDFDVRKYVLDRWEWERTFAANTLRYTQPQGT